MDISLITPGMEVLYNGSKFREMRGKRVEVVKLMAGQPRAVCSWNGDGYLLRLEHLSVPKGIQHWDGVKPSEDKVRKDGRRVVSFGTEEEE